MGVEKFPDSLLRIAHGTHGACSCSPDAAVGSGNPGAAGIAAAHLSMRQNRSLLYLEGFPSRYIPIHETVLAPRWLLRRVFQQPASPRLAGS
jgi:hypothetical protein